MKKYTLILVCSMASYNLIAQVQRTHARQTPDSTVVTANKETNESKREILKDLNLTREQKLRIRELNQSMKSSKAEIEADSMLTTEQKQEKVKALKKDQLLQIQALLTEEQKIKFKEIREKQKNKD